MTTALEYERRITSYSWEQLQSLWNGIQSSNTPDWESGKALEYVVLRAFQLEGANVVYPYSVLLEEEELEQIDGVIYSDGFACLIECKDLADRVNIEPIAKMRNQLLRRPATTIGVVFSRSGFTLPASILARYLAPQTILLWSGQELNYALSTQRMRRSLVEKYRYCVERGEPDYDIRPENLP